MSFKAVRAHEFIEELISTIDGDAGWGGVFGTKPRISKKTERKVGGFVGRKTENIIIYARDEEISPFSIGLNDQTNSWFHTIRAQIDIDTNISETRYETILSAIIDILKRNVAKTDYVQWVVERVSNMSKDVRNSFVGYVIVRGEIMNPVITVGLAANARVTEDGEERVIENGEGRVIE